MWLAGRYHGGSVQLQGRDAEEQTVPVGEHELTPLPLSAELQNDSPTLPMAASDSTKLHPVVQLGVCVGGIYVSFLVWALVSLSLAVGQSDPR